MISGLMFIGTLSLFVGLILLILSGGTYKNKRIRNLHIVNSIDTQHLQSLQTTCIKLDVFLKDPSLTIDIEEVLNQIKKHSIDFQQTLNQYDSKTLLEKLKINRNVIAYVYNSFKELDIPKSINKDLKSNIQKTIQQTLEILEDYLP